MCNPFSLLHLPFISLLHLSLSVLHLIPADFPSVAGVAGSNPGSWIDFRQFCEWIQSAELAAGTPIGHELMNDPMPSSASALGSRARSQR